MEWAAARTYYVKRLFPRGQEPEDDPPVLPPGWVHVADDDLEVDGDQGSGNELGSGPEDSPWYGLETSLGSCTWGQSQDREDVASEEVDGPRQK